MLILPNKLDILSIKYLKILSADARREMMTIKSGIEIAKPIRTFVITSCFSLLFLIRIELNPTTNGFEVFPNARLNIP
jgi:hypothetical protein